MPPFAHAPRKPATPWQTWGFVLLPVTPYTFMTLTGNKVITDMFEIPQNFEVEHISVAKMADLFVIVPATANVIGKIAGGIADDFVTTTIMATKAPVLIAPAMNTSETY